MPGPRISFIQSRAVARSENQGRRARSTVVDIICPLIEIGLTVRPKTWGLKPLNSSTPAYNSPVLHRYSIIIRDGGRSKNLWGHH